MKYRPLFHVPHDGNMFPKELMDSVIVSDAVFAKYHEAMRDTRVRDLIPPKYRNDDHTVNFEVSRLLCDVERFIGTEEIMERYGMGFCYEKAYDGTVIKIITGELKEKTLRYYRTHHDRMDRMCAGRSNILLIDLHSYSDEIIPPAQRSGLTPDLCIGTDPVFTPDDIKEAFVSAFEKAGFSVDINEPYSGCFVPNAVLRGDARCASVMLEFHKRCYLVKSAEEERIRNIIRNVLEGMKT